MNKKSIIYFGVIVIILVCTVLFLYKKVYITNQVKEDTSVITKESEENKSPELKPVLEEKKIIEINQIKKMDKEINTLEIKVIKEGTGDLVSKNGDKLTMNYTGSLLNGTKFDSNVDPVFGHVDPFDFVIGRRMVIRGWEEGLLGMKIGEKRILTIPAEMAYGGMSPSPLIPANSPLVFEVELLKIN